MTRRRALSAVAALAVGLVSLAVPVLAAPATVPGVPWVRVAPKEAFPPVVPGIVRPSGVLETNSYVYGPGTGFSTPELRITLDDRGYSAPATLYLCWQNRDTGATLFYNVHQGFVNNEVDLFGDGRPIRILVPKLDDFVLFGQGDTFSSGAFGTLPGTIPAATGHYQFVLEVRDADGVNVVSRTNAMYNQVDGVQTVSGPINSSQTWTSNFLWLMTTPVNVFAPAILTIEPGTVVIGSRAGQGTLVIRPGAKIMADGEVMDPIVFTSEEAVGQRAPGDWGGLVLNGNAPTNQGTNPRPVGEGESGEYGGNDPADNSGVLRYVRVEFAGIRFNEENELNGIALQGVGTGTTLEHLQIHYNKDDGIEFFGGTVNLKYVLVTGAEDDSFDWTFGWTGKAQHIVAIQRVQEGDHGIEADNFDVNPDASPRSNPTISHCTFIGLFNQDDDPGEDPAFLLRRGTAASISNCIVEGFTNADSAVVVDGDESNALVGTQLFVDNSYFFNNSGAHPLAGLGSNHFNNPLLADPTAPCPDVAPLSGSPARTGGSAPAGAFFDKVGWVGGVDPNAPWINEGWTVWSDN